MQHPAKYNKKLIPHIERMLGGCGMKILDPFAGTGYIFNQLPQHNWYGLEIEPEWAILHPKIVCGNALLMNFDQEFDACVTSPCYGNRMADHHEAKDGSRRTTYRHYLGRPLSVYNSGSWPWGGSYCLFHGLVWTAVYEALKPSGILILNIKDHIRKGQHIKVTDWHIETLVRIGFLMVDHEKIPLRGNGFGKNGNVRVGHESLIKFVKDSYITE